MSSLAFHSLRPLSSPTSLRRGTRSCEISGQCGVCHDLFTLTVHLVRGIPTIANTPRVQWRLEAMGEGTRHTLIHRPDVCNGEITLYGSLETLSIPTSAAYHIVPAAKTTYRNRSNVAS